MTRILYRVTITTFITLLISSIANFNDLEASRGLDTLFAIRGSVQAPDEVVILAMDETSKSRLGVWQDLTEWRRFHPKLIQELKRQGAALIIFDLQFVTPLAEDPLFAQALREAGNVLMVDCVQKLHRGVEGFDGQDECSKTNGKPFVCIQESGHIEECLDSNDMSAKQDGQPLSEGLTAMRKIASVQNLVAAALDHAPFIATNDAENSVVRENWLFLDSLAEAPTLPIVAWLYSLEGKGELQNVRQPGTPFSAWLTAKRRLCLSGANKFSENTQPKTILDKRINGLICGEDSRHLNFYGPPKTFRMESYSDVYEGKISNLQDKVVFVGKANRKFLPGKPDFFQTPFTDTHSGKIAGVEIMATQFANLLENRFIKAPMPPIAVHALFGLVVALLVSIYPGSLGIGISLLASGLYTAFVAWCFYRNNLWLPVVVPLLFQLLPSWFISLLWSRFDLLDERKRILAFVRRVFPQWLPFLPSSPGQWHPDDLAAELASERDVRGICLATDIEGYTTVAAHHTSHQMWELLNAYYQVLGHPVSSHDGIIADVAGDAMIAVWIDLPVAKQRLAACIAALEMELAVGRFNENAKVGRLPTRIGLHEGDMTLGRLDSGEASHYRAIGDTVNTASRIQGVNKYLGTQILASKAITDNLADVICRPVGLFRLVGRDEPIELMEIVGMVADAQVLRKSNHKKFARGLQAFQQGQWQQAVEYFQDVLDQHGNDGPSLFYLELALAYQDNPPPKWEGVVSLGGK